MFTDSYFLIIKIKLYKFTNQNSFMRHQIKFDQYQEGAKGLSAGKVILYLIIALIIGMVILNFISAIGVGGCVAVIPLSGEISTSKGYGMISSSDVISLIKQAEERPDIKSIAMVVNSPGGSAVASDEIYSYLKQVKKPKVVYIEEIGASGGYYISLAGDYIYSNPMSVTGSIGARTGWIIDMSRWLNNTGIDMTSITSGKMKDSGEIYGPMTEEEKAVFKSIIDDIAARFLNLTISERSKNSKFTNESVQLISDARIFTGKQAYDIGLVDELGTRQDAIDKAAELGGLDKNPSVCELTIKQDLFSSLFNEMGRGIGEALYSKVNFNSLKIQ